jgi:hypothetical protein
MQETDPLNAIAGETAESLAEKRRARDAARKRKEREAIKRRKEALSRSTNESEWYQSNRNSLSGSELASLESQDGEIREILLSMESLQGQDEELTQIVIDHVKENGVVYLSRIVKDDRIPPNWSETAYWKNVELLEALEAESDQNAIFHRYGLLIALIDWRVIDYLTKKVGWQWNEAANLVGYVEERGGYKHR